VPCNAIQRRFEPALSDTEWIANVLREGFGLALGRSHSLFATITTNSDTQRIQLDRCWRDHYVDTCHQFNPASRSSYCLNISLCIHTLGSSQPKSGVSYVGTHQFSSVTSQFKSAVMTLRAAAHQLRQDKHQDMRQKRQKLTLAS
jgi:hypothetical protein